jgi:aminomethyltransferase
MVDGPPARDGAKIQTTDGVIVGHVTSGAPSPSLKKSIG